GSPVRSIGVDHLHVPLERGERVRPVLPPTAVTGLRAGATRDRRLGALLGEAVRHVRLRRADAVVQRDAGDTLCVANLLGEPDVVGAGEHAVYLVVPVDHGSACRDDGLLGGEGAALAVDDDVFV